MLGNPGVISQGVPQNPVRYPISNFLAYDALRIFILDIFPQIFRRLLKIFHDFKIWAIFEQVMKEILTEEQNKIQQNLCLIKLFLLQFTFYNFHNL